MPRTRTQKAPTTTTRNARSTAATSAKLDKSNEAVKNSEAAKSTEFVCPECGRTFTRAASLGAHRFQAHKVAGAKGRPTKRAARATAVASARTGTRRRIRTRAAAAPATTSANGAANRDALLRTLFPNGIPAKESVIRSVNAWLDEAERLARER